MTTRHSAPDSASDTQLSTDEVTGEVRDVDGLLVDAYSDDTLAHRNSIDALDVAPTHLHKSQLEALSAATDPLEARDVPRRAETMDTVDSGARQTPTDDGEMGLAAEPHSAEDLERASIGRALKGASGVTRDGEVHDERLLDSPDEES